jgi:hypothetical protein
MLRAYFAFLHYFLCPSQLLISLFGILEQMVRPDILGVGPDLGFWLHFRHFTHLLWNLSSHNSEMMAREI